MESFRSEVKTWLQENCPAGVKGPAKEEDTVWGGRNAIWPSEDARLWLQAMGKKVGPVQLGQKNTAVAA